MVRLSTAQHLLAVHAAANSQATFVYETTLKDGFGDELSRDAQSNGIGGTAQAGSGKVWKMDTRPGTGAALSGYINTLTSPSTSSNALSPLPVSALLSPYTLQSMIPSLLSLDHSKAPRPTYNLHVACLSGSAHRGLADDMSSVLEATSCLASLGSTNLAEERAAIVFSGSEPADIIAYGVGLSVALSRAGYDLVHVFDGLEGSRELTLLSPAEELTSEEIAASAEGALDLETALFQAMAAIQKYSLLKGDGWFDYAGPEDATHVLVIPASSASAHAAASAFFSAGGSSVRVGVLIVRVLRPWSPARLAAALPSTAEVLHVYSASGADGLLESVLTANLELKRPTRVVPFEVPRDARWNAREWAANLYNAVAKVTTPPATPLPAASPDYTISKEPILTGVDKLCIVWSGDQPHEGSHLAVDLAEALASEGPHGVSPRLSVEYDNYSQGGIQRSVLLLSRSQGGSISVSVVGAAEKPSLVVISSPSEVLSAYSPLGKENLTSTTQVLIASPGWTPDEFDVKFDAPTKRALWEVYGAGRAKGGGGIWNIDLFAVTKELIQVAPSKATEVGVWLLYFGAVARSSPQVAGLLAKTGSFDALDAGLLGRLVDAVRENLHEVKVPLGWEYAEQEGFKIRNGTRAQDTGFTRSRSGFDSKAEHDAGQAHSNDATADAVPPELQAPGQLRPHRLWSNSTGPNAYKTFDEPPPVSATWRDAAKVLAYSEAYGVADRSDAVSKRPDLPEDNYILRVTENRRLTPLDYDRNVFHVELSTAGTGLKYAIGEALGVHGWNDAGEVAEFLAWYGLDPEAAVSVPNRIDPQGRQEVRTVFQAFQQNLDLFGKPPKSFYEELSKVARVKAEKDHLHFIASAEGSSTFRKWSELDTVSYADVFKAFPSARFALPDLVRQVEPIKPRHYSIASSQHFVGDSVHLLVVTVDWRTPSGGMKYGQCTRYLAGLETGSEVMVSVKPSVMKLPPSDKQPIVMAGLGTGAAPFRAFIQERAWQRSQGIDVGPLVYYFGSRHRSKEYLYGEELEAYMLDGIVTHAGLAFSRDGPRKVYIQHKMMEDSDMLASMLTTDGVFYLCGPTWPVPDVYEALCRALSTKGMERKEAEKYLEGLKEKEAYVLETY